MNNTEQHRIYAWLGYWRDKIPPDAVEALQDILGPLQGPTVQPSPAPKDDPAVLREYLRVYGGHIYPCPGRPCECGFQKAWEVAGLPITPDPTPVRFSLDEEYDDTNTDP